ncbi:MAG: hypothetical protein IJ835_04165 [Muribaculaceae bacterium]|nr:hypothetical protein [Muribaculaceae bacterium]MBR1935227.1 hypothetical protein [Muribaculaceae bacterium]
MKLIKWIIPVMAIMLSTAIIAQVKDGGDAKAICVSAQAGVRAMSSAQYHSTFKNNRGNGVRIAVVDFGAEWCGWCKKLQPIIEQLAEDYAGRVDFYKVDIDKSQDLYEELNLDGVPYVYVFPKNGKPDIIDGFAEYDEIAAVINSML